MSPEPAQVDGGTLGHLRPVHKQGQRARTSYLASVCFCRAAFLTAAFPQQHQQHPLGTFRNAHPSPRQLTPTASKTLDPVAHYPPSDSETFSPSKTIALELTFYRNFLF